jgi:hypothetical protein
MPSTANDPAGAGMHDVTSATEPEGQNPFSTLPASQVVLQGSSRPVAQNTPARHGLH